MSPPQDDPQIGDVWDKPFLRVEVLSTHPDGPFLWVVYNQQWFNADGSLYCATVEKTTRDTFYLVVRGMTCNRRGDETC